MPINKQYANSPGYDQDGLPVSSTPRALHEFMWIDYISNSGVTNNTCQIVNPADSGVDVVIRTAKLFLSGAGSIRLYVNSTQMSGLIGADFGALTSAGGTPAAELYEQKDVTIDGSRIADIYYGSAQEKDVIALEGFKIVPGHNLTIHCPTDLIIAPNITWSEETA